MVQNNQENRLKYWATCLLALLTRSLALPYSIYTTRFAHTLHCARSLCSLAHFAHSLAHEMGFFSVFFSILAHSAAGAGVNAIRWVATLVAVVEVT